MNSTFADLVHVIESAACGKNYWEICMQLAETFVDSTRVFIAPNAHIHSTHL
jgi:hypothetical protein